MPRPKFLLDADMPRSSAAAIRSLGFDVQDVRDLGMRYATDQEIIDYALNTGRIVITRDLDYGEILRYPQHPGAIILRLPTGFVAREVNEALLDFLASARSDIFQQAIIIVELGRYRRRPLKT
jgi:predicted nuclease of predicted toxin-antitoxin system